MHSAFFQRNFFNKIGKSCSCLFDKFTTTTTSTSSRTSTTTTSPSLGPRSQRCISNTMTMNRMTTNHLNDASVIRNVGIIAHVDAGKTTTSERMLYYSGFSTHLGDVDRGDTIMDFLEQERERGITINSAAVTFSWNHHKINLIDTPGHVDFTMEVERVLRVLDGAVMILDSSAGVEAQTATVWRQADKYNIPTIVYLNKMDKKGADVHHCLHSLRNKLGVTPLLLHIPVGIESTFAGIVDLVHFDLMLWDAAASIDGASFIRKPLSSCEDAVIYKRALAARTTLICELAEHDEYIADIVLGDSIVEEISAVDLQSAVRRVTLAKKLIPVLCGSSLKNKGVQTLMDAVVSYLPSPKDICYEFTSCYGTDLCALAFKVSHHKQRGPLTFLRIYSGSIERGSTVFNVSQQSTERISRVLQVHADEYVDISQAVAGNIVAVAGFKQTITGDTITSSQTVAKAASKALQLNRQITVDFQHENDVEETYLPVLSGLTVPSPVFFCSIEPFSVAYQKKLDHALMCLQKEDPSLKVEVNAETGQTVLSGMGELHLCIIQSRLAKEYGIDAELGPLQVAYRETVSDRVHVTEILDKKIGDGQHYVCIKMSVSPDIKVPQLKEIQIDPANDLAILHFRPQHRKALENGVKASLSRGPLLGFPVINISVMLHEFHMQRGTSLAMLSACAMQCVSEAIRKAGPQLLEPIMKIEITTDENRLHAVLVDLAQRRSHIINHICKHDEHIVEAETPLAELKGYSTDLRTITSGTASFSMQLSHYNKMNKEDQQRIVKA